MKIEELGSEVRAYIGTNFRT